MFSISTSSSLHNLLAEIGSILQDIIQLCIFILKKMFLAQQMRIRFVSFFKIMRRFRFNRCFKG